MKRLGVAVSRMTVHAVAVERGRVTWAGERALDGTLVDLATALAELAAERPPGIHRARVVLDGDACRVKFLNGLPPLSTSRLDRAVGLQVGRWFVRNGSPLVTRAAWRERGVRALTAAAERALLEAVVEGLGRADLALDGLSAAVLLVATLLPDGCHQREIGATLEELVVKQGRLEELRRHVLAAPAQPACSFAVPGLDGAGAAFLAAYAASARPPMLDFRRVLARATQVQRWRRTVLAVSGVGLLLWSAAAGVFAMRTSAAVRGAEATLTRLGPEVDATLAVQRDLLLADEALNVIAGAEHARSQDAALLEMLTAAVPDSAYLVTIRRSPENRVTVVGYAPSAARVLTAVAGRASVSAAALEGPVTRELGVEAGRERFALGFDWRPREFPR